MEVSKRFILVVSGTHLGLARNDTMRERLVVTPTVDNLRKTRLR